MGTALLSLQQTSTDSRLSRSLWFHGALITFHADSKDTGGKFALLEFSGGPGGEPPRHVHKNEDELFYVIEGRLQVFRGEEELILHAGDSVFLPRLVPHTFKVLSNSARGLVYLTPGGFEGYFRELGQPAAKLALPQTAPPLDVEKMVRTGNRYGITFLP